MKTVVRVGLLVAYLGAAGPSFAQATKRDAGSALAGSLTGDARKAYDEARAFYNQGEFARALESLERAHKLSADPRLLWNIAACEKKLGRWASAMRHVERYRSAAATMIGDAEKREADEFVSAAAAYVGMVTVASNIDGTEIFVDDELLGTTPLPKPIAVDEGEHRVRFVRGSFRAVERKERVPAGAQLRWVVELEREAAPPAAAPPRPPPPTTTVRDAAPTRSPSRLGPILLGVGGALVGGAGTVLVITAHSDAKAIEDDCGTRCPPSRWEGDRTRERIGDVMLGVGAAAVVGAIVWWIVQPDVRVGQAPMTAGASW